MKTGMIRRIAVAIDCSPCSLASLNAAAEMAGMLRAELIGIFVEDINLLRMAELPFAEEIRLYTATKEKIGTEQLERLLRLQAREARQLLQRAAEQFTIPHSFRVSRGIVPEEVIAAAIEADLLVLGRSGRSPSCRKGLGSTAKTALAKGKKTVMLMRPGFSVTTPLLVLYDGTEGSRAALETARDITRPGGTLHLLFTAETPEEKTRCEREAVSMLSGTGIRPEFHHLPLSNGKRLAQFIRMIDSGILILSDRMGLSDETLRNLIDEIDYPVLLVRQP
jgi:nucleotide-binding universal stress UspA family protein